MKLKLRSAVDLKKSQAGLRAEPTASILDTHNTEWSFFLEYGRFAIGTSVDMNNLAEDLIGSKVFCGLCTCPKGMNIGEQQLQ